MRPQCALSLCLTLLAGVAPAQAPPGAASAPKPVLLELYTSEGSANCPPADDLLIRFQREQPVAGVRVIPLSFHVDIWDAFGWKDPFATPSSTQRQADYNKYFEDTSAYTPELVVDGSFSLVGSLEQQALTAIERLGARDKIAVDLKRDGKELTVSVADASGTKGSGKVNVWLAIAEDGVTSEVKKGENAGKTLSHTGVVRALQLLGAIEVGQTSFTASYRPSLAFAWKKENLRAVAWIQAAGSHKVLGVAEVKMKD